MKKSILWVLALLILPISANAQVFTYEGSELQSNNAYIVAGSVFELDGAHEDSRLMGAAKLGAGFWFNKYLGFELTGVAGKSIFPTEDLTVDNKFKTYGIDLSYMAYIFGAKSFQRFNLVADLGVGYFKNTAVGSGAADSYAEASAMKSHLGLRAIYNVTPKLSLYAEPMGVLQTTYYNKADNNKMEGVAMFALGATYTFKDKFKDMKMVPNYTPRERYARLERALSQGSAPAKCGKKKPCEKKSAAKSGNISRPANSVYLDVLFAEYDYKLTDAEIKKISNICSWMLKNNVKINIVAFSEDESVVSLSTVLRANRTDVVKKALVEKCGVSESDIKIVTPAEAGYNGVNGSFAKILFVTK